MDPNCTAERHGDRNTDYQAGCRCNDARRAHAHAIQRWRNRRYLNGRLLIDPTGTRRRLQALAAIGWTYAEIGEQLGCTAETVQNFTVATGVRASTAKRVDQLYRRLCMTLGPSTHARGRAAAKGWPPPLAWDDDTIDDPATRPVGIRPRPYGPPHDDIDWAVVDALVAGVHHGHCTRAERLQAITRLHRQGLTFREIAEKVRRDIRVVTRDIAELGLTRRDAA